MPRKKSKGNISLIWTPAAGEDLCVSKFVGLRECRYVHMCSVCCWRTAGKWKNVVFRVDLVVISEPGTKKNKKR